ncbi:MAG: N-acetyltransferase [Phycisphaera sp.]|nr:MAG: N-acetyltransferase [Phycisphaera sp.]
MHQLVTKRLIIREPLESDAQHLYEGIFSDPLAMKYIGDGAPRDLAMVEESLRRRIAFFKEHGVSLMTVTLKDTGEIIGDCGVLPYNWEGPQIELAYRYRPSAWGNGYAKEAGKAVLESVWRVTEIEELLGVTDMDNIASQKVLLSLGFEDLGTTTAFYGQEELRHFRISRPGA